MVFVLQHFIFRAARTPALLSTDFFLPLLFLCFSFQDSGLKEVQESATGQISVDGLRTIVLAFYEEASRPMQQLNAGGSFVDVLASGPA